MQQLRRKIGGEMEDMSASARTMIDWKHYVKTYPWVCLGAAAALGFLIVPKRSKAINAEPATPTELTKSGHLVVQPAPAAARGWVEGLLAIVVSIAVREVIAYLGQSAGRLLGCGRHDPSESPPDRGESTMSDATDPPPALPNGVAKDMGELPT